MARTREGRRSETQDCVGRCSASGGLRCCDVDETARRRLELRSWQGSRDFPSPNVAAADERDAEGGRSPRADDTARPSVLEKENKILLKGVRALDLRAFRGVERISLRVGSGMDRWVRFYCDGVGLNREIGCVEVSRKDCWSPNACAVISRREWRGELVQRWNRGRVRVCGRSAC